MVLMVDDDPDVRTSVARGLRHSGFDVRVAATGKEALRLLSNESHDALVLDVQMPELDGVAVVTALRALGNDIPICVLSARDTVNDRIAGLEAGADDYLTKPFDLGELVARLHALLRRAQPFRSAVGHDDGRAADHRHRAPAGVRRRRAGRADQARVRSARRAGRERRRGAFAGSGCSSWCGATTSTSTPTSPTCSSPICGASSNATACRG